MHGSWRRWLPGPKHGVARGTAVFGSRGTDPDALVELLAQCPTLRVSAHEAGVHLDDGPGSLQPLDDRLDAWSREPHLGPRLGNEAGCYLGTVIVTQVPGAHWRVWPNGHPVVRLRSGRELDVAIAVACYLVGLYTGTGSKEPERRPSAPATPAE